MIKLKLQLLELRLQLTSQRIGPNLGARDAINTITSLGHAEWILADQADDQNNDA
jgi:hypothetical protein